MNHSSAIRRGSDAAIEPGRRVSRTDQDRLAEPMRGTRQRRFDRSVLPWLTGTAPPDSDAQAIITGALIFSSDSGSRRPGAEVSADARSEKRHSGTAAAVSGEHHDCGRGTAGLNAAYL